MSGTVSRRRFLTQALGLAAGGLAGSLSLTGCRPVRYPERPLTFLTPKEWAALDAASGRLVPRLPGFRGAQDLPVAAVADQLFASANPRLQNDLKQLLNTLEDLTWLNLRFQPFTMLDDDAQAAYLRSWERSSLGLQRQAFVALSKITAMLFYADPASWPQIGYPGPWIGRYDFGQGLANQGDLAANPNPHVFERVAP
ncbi:hypothetical protein D3C86_401930 [compost metagenome]